MTPSQRTLAHVFFAAVLAIIGANTLVFAARTANPLISADAWNSVDTIVRDVATGHLQLADLFAIRGPLDHSQPLRKVILLFHYRYFDLDFSVEAIIGVLAAFLALGAMWLIARPGPAAGDRDRLGAMVVFAAMAGVYLSLNAPVAFNWPLLTLGYTNHPFLLAFLCTAWAACRDPGRGRLALVFAAALAMDIVADDTGLLCTLAMLMAGAWLGMRERRGVPALRVATIALAAYVVYRLLRAWLLHALPDVSGGAGPGLAGLAHGLVDNAAGIPWALRIPLVASVAHRMQLKFLLGPDTGWVETGIALAMLLAHAWFWWRALRGHPNRVMFVAVALMLMFYGLVAGMLLARISVHGLLYFWQPRYVPIYQWNLVALLLMALARWQDPPVAGSQEAAGSPSTAARFGRALPVVLAALLLLWQVPLSRASWVSAKYVSAYQQRYALQMGALAANPGEPPTRCAPALLACRYDLAHRIEVMRFLQTRHLNLFSPAFRARNRLYADPAQLPH